MLSYDKLKIVHSMLEKYADKFEKDTQLILDLVIIPGENTYVEFRIVLGDRRIVTGETVEELIAKLIKFME